ncbi:hypothetical protein JZ751_023984, partial [Albula glossodonta]
DSSSGRRPSPKLPHSAISHFLGEDRVKDILRKRLWPKQVYVGNLGNNGNKTELERSFGYYGPLRSVWVARNPPGFAFVEFEDPRDATDAVRELDGRTLCGCRVRVELSSGEKRTRNRGPPPSWSRRPRDDYRHRSPAPRRRVTTMPLLTTL